MQNWGYSPEEAKLRLQGSWQPADALEREQSRAALPEAAAELAGPELEAQPGETPFWPDAAPYLGNNDPLNHPEEFDWQGWEDGQIEEFERKSQAEQREILSDMLDGMITLKEAEARWIAPSTGGSLEEFKAHRQQTPREHLSRRRRDRRGGTLALCNSTGHGAEDQPISKVRSGARMASSFP